MNEEDPNWNGAYNTSAAVTGASPLSQYEAGVLSTDSPMVAHNKVMFAEMERERRENGESRGGDIFPALIFLGYLIPAVLGGFILWTAGVFVYKEYTHVYSRTIGSVEKIAYDLKGANTHEQAMSYALMSAFRFGGDRQNSEITNYINTAPVFADYRNNIKPSLDAAKSWGQRLKVTGEYWKVYGHAAPNSKNAPIIFALRYDCLFYVPSPNCSLFNGNSPVREVLDGKSFLPQKLCAPLLHLQLSRAVSHVHEIQGDVHELIDRCTKVQSDTDTVTLRIKQVSAQLLSKLVGLLPEKYAEICVSNLVTVFSLVRTGIMTLIY